MKHKNDSRAGALFGVAALILIAVLGAYILNAHSLALLTAGDDDEAVDNPEAYAAAVAMAVSAPKVKYQVSSSTPQFVLLSFDGSKSLSMLNETLDFERTMAAKGKSLRFTYFINAVYFFTKDTAQGYQAPRTAKGTSNIGFSNSPQDIIPRVKAFNLAFAEGNEIGSHTAGHFNGTNWSYDEWAQEFASFASLMATVQQNNPGLQIDTPIFITSIHGFRAPNLGVNDNLYKVLKDFHFTYDTSGVGSPGRWPEKDTYGVWHIPLGTIFVGPKRSAVVAMDYNLRAHEAGGNKDVATKGTPLWNTYFDEVLSAYMDYFNSNYKGNRAPIVIAGHFSKFNDGVYWEAMKTFADYVCGQPQVRCVTFKDVVGYLNTTGVPPIIK